MASAWMPAGINKRKGIIHEAVPRHAAAAREARTGDAHAEMPAFARAGMPGMQVAVVLHLDPGLGCSAGRCRRASMRAHG
jgi:hypothetical protein